MLGNPEIVAALVPVAVMGILFGVGGWVLTTWLRIKNGYPLESSWGKAIHPIVPTETAERLRMLATDNARLQAEVASLKDRIAVVERIATDSPARLAHEIDALRN